MADIFDTDSVDDSVIKVQRAQALQNRFDLAMHDLGLPIKIHVAPNLDPLVDGDVVLFVHVMDRRKIDSVINRLEDLAACQERATQVHQNATLF